MKVYFSLLSILSTIIIAIPTLHSSTHIEPIEKSVDLTAAHRAPAERYPKSDEVVKRASAVCNLNFCGTVSVSDCEAELTSLASDSGGEGSPVCANNDIITLGNKCEVAFNGVKQGIICISPKRLSGLARDVFNACIYNPKVATVFRLKMELMYVLENIIVSTVSDMKGNSTAESTPHPPAWVSRIPAPTLRSMPLASNNFVM